MSFKIALFNIADFVKKSRFSSLGLGYIASYLRKYSDFHDLYIIEGNGLAKLRQIKPDIIGIYSVTQRFNEAVSLARSIKKEWQNIPIIIGGYHISALPHTLPNAFDIGILGEGEETMRELIMAIAEHGLKADKLANIKGIVFRYGNDLKINSPRAFIQDIDSIPFPARDLTGNNQFSSIITSRGCPYSCVFCASVSFWRKPRFHSAEYIVNEIEEIINKHKSVHISIWDDLFITDKARLESICNLIQSRKINKKVSFGCALRSNLVDSKVCALLKGINIKRVSLGFETGSQKILDFLKCGSVTVQQHIMAVKLCKSYGFYTTGTFMLGAPGETEGDLLKTLFLIRDLQLDGGGTLTLTVPLPGTQLWGYAKQKRLVSDNMDFSRLGIMSTDFSDPDGFKGILLTDKITKEKFFQIAQEIQKESNRYYLKGLLRLGNISIKNIKFMMARPKEVMAILKFIIKSFLHRAAIMDRYIYYYTKSDS